MGDGQSALWTLVYKTLKPKDSDSSPNACLNRLTNERLSSQPVIQLNEKTAVVREEVWLTEHLNTLGRKHERMHELEDDRPIIVVEYQKRKLLIDGNHRVTRWLSEGLREQHRVLLIALQKESQ